MTKKLIVLLCIVVLIHRVRPTKNQRTQRPVIGILAQPTDESLSSYGGQYIVASYVKWIESAGARVVPILYNETPAMFHTIFNRINGLLFPGGHCGFHGTLYGNASWSLMEMAKDANDNGDHFPMWGTCQGYQQLLQFGSSLMEPSVLTKTAGTEGLLAALNFTTAGVQSRFMRNASRTVLNALASLPITINLHHFSVTTSKVEHPGSKLHNFFEVVANNYDSNGLEFTSLVEARQYPFYGSQFHPEKNAFEWSQGWEVNDTAKLAHSIDAIEAMQYLVNFFVNEARNSSHVWDSDTPSFPLIYNFTPFNKIGGDKWEQVYIF